MHGRRRRHLDAPIVDVADARGPLREQGGHCQRHGGVRDVVAVVVNAAQAPARRPCAIKLQAFHSRPLCLTMQTGAMHGRSNAQCCKL